MRNHFLAAIIEPEKLGIRTKLLLLRPFYQPYNDKTNKTKTNKDFAAEKIGENTPFIYGLFCVLLCRLHCIRV